MPTLVTNHKELLFLNTKELPVYKDAVPGIPGVDVQPLMLDTHRGVWVLRVLFHPGVVLPTHYHTGSVHLWTLSGKWFYLEYPDQPQTAGCYLYEPGSSIHTFCTPKDNTELTDTLMYVEGSNVNFHPETGEYVGMLDANTIVQLVEGLIKERGLKPARYIRPDLPSFTTAR
jgi:quercetin dioxygenase-like cupin family protein